MFFVFDDSTLARLYNLQGAQQAALQNDLAIVISFGVGAIGSDVRTIGIRPVLVPEPVEAESFELVGDQFI